jgi:beta-glucosidase
MKNKILSLLLIVISAVNAQEKLPFRDQTLPVEIRVQDFISRLTLQEKSEQMMHNAPAVKRLGVLPYSWWNEALHGVARTGRATVFPQCIGLAATFDEDLMKRIGEAISDEAWAKYNLAQKLENYSQYSGVTFYTPNVNLFRDPRWGRGQETYGEDPYLTSRMSLGFVKGMQGDDPKYLKTAACAKHYVVHSGPEELRHSFDAEPSMKDFIETYTPAFETLVKEGKVESIMCAYNRTFGKPCCGSSYLLNDLLRNQWGFKGYVTTDCWAIQNFYKYHGTTPDEAESVALAIKSGVNLCCGNEFRSIPEAVKRGLISEKEVDDALAVLLRTRFKLGLMDPVNNNPYTAIKEDVIGCQKHINLAYEAAAKSIVLLQNNNSVLPLKKNLKNIFIVGPYAANQDVLLGNYNGLNDRLITVLQAVVGKVSGGTTVSYREGVEPSAFYQNKMNYSLGEVREADAVIAVFGISGIFEGEEGESIASSTRGDRMDLNIPANQLQYLREMKKNCKKPIILVLTGGSPVCTEELKTIADAIVFVWYPGQEGGRAVADVIFGDVNPSGKLPVTFPKSVNQLPDFKDYSMKGRTYRYMTEEPLYPFGFGLSYTTFAYSNIKLTSPKIKKLQSTSVTATITNAGKYAGEEVVQLYVTDLVASTSTPLYSLKGIKRVHLQPGESKEVSFDITPEMLMLVNENGEKILEPGDFKISIGGSVPSSMSVKLGASESVSAILTVNTKPIIRRRR